MYGPRARNLARSLGLGHRKPALGERVSRFNSENTGIQLDYHADLCVKPSFLPKDTTYKHAMATQSPLDVYSELASLPMYSAAEFQSKDVLRVTSKFPDFDRESYRTSTSTYFVTENQVFSSFAPDGQNIVVSATSPSGKHLAVLREITESGSPKRFVELWACNKLEASLEVTKIHGAFYSDDIFSLVSFSPSENAFVYTAEDQANDEKDSESLDKYYFVPPLGEGYPGKKSPGLYLFKWGPDALLVKPLRPSNALTERVLLTQPVFAKEDQVFAVGYSYTADHKLLGVKYCPNRIAGIYSLSLPAQITKEIEGDIVCSVTTWTTPHLSCRSPRVFTASGATPRLLVYLANPVGGPHASCSSLHVIDADSKKEVLTIPIVDEPKADGFPGLYAITLPPHPFIRIDEIPYLVCTSGWRSRSTVVLVSLKDGTVKDLTPDDFSWNVLSTDGGSQLICARSSLTSPPELLLGTIQSVPVTAQWRTIAKQTLSDRLQERLSSLEFSIIPIKERHSVETILLRRKNVSGSLPCVSIIHGGPHGCTTTTFNAASIALALENYAVSLPNYTGSVGFGDAHIKRLLGHIGTLDVEDCLKSVEQLINSGITKSGPGQQFLLGGSHGGFILGHLLGQYPDVFSAASIRNPVTHLGDITGTDIPDWYFEESGVPYTPTSLMTPELYQRLYEMSPIAHVDETRADIPILLFIGEKDARVSNSQGKTYYHALKGRGKNIKMLTLKEDSHPLDSVEGLKVVFKATRELFEASRKN